MDSFDKKGLSSELLDKQNLLAKIDGDNNLLEQMFQLAAVQLPVYISDLERSLDKDDFESACKLAHKLKGAAFSICCNSLADLSLEMERKISDFLSGGDPPDYTEIMKHLKKIMSELLPLLENP